MSTVDCPASSVNGSVASILTNEVHHPVRLTNYPVAPHSILAPVDPTALADAEEFLEQLRPVAAALSLSTGFTLTPFLRPDAKVMVKVSCGGVELDTFSPLGSTEIYVREGLSESLKMLARRVRFGVTNATMEKSRKGWAFDPSRGK